MNCVFLTSSTTERWIVGGGGVNEVPDILFCFEDCLISSLNYVTNNFRHD